MTFILRMATREIRSSWQRLLFFFVCIAVGVAAIIALRSVIQSVRAGMSQQAQTLIASDILLTSNRDFTPKVLDTIASEQRSGRVAACCARAAAGGAGGRFLEWSVARFGFPIVGGVHPGVERSGLR